MLVVTVVVFDGTKGWDVVVMLVVTVVVFEAVLVMRLH